MSYFNVKQLNETTHIINGINVTKNSYLNLFNNAINTNHDYFFNEIDNYFNYNDDTLKQEIDKIALPTQIGIKKSKMLFLHGYLLYIALDKYLKDNPDIEFINILETGTAKGFSSLCMAKALYDNKRNGKIYTIDILPNNIKMYWNSIKDFEGKKSRPELLDDFKHLLKYITFVTGNTLDILKNIDKRIHFAFLDARHDYKHLNFELQWTNSHQKTNDVIICDDYTIYNNGSYQYPGIIKAIDKFTGYNKKIFYGNDGTKKRGYVFMKKNDN